MSRLTLQMVCVKFFQNINYIKVLSTYKLKLN
jgi:hypothetical protein